MRFRLTRIDELLRPDHVYLSADDECFFLREYTASAGYLHSETNSLISNFKKETQYRSRPEVWRYKQRAIDQLADELAQAIRLIPQLRQAVWVPIPPSKLPDHPDHDDRVMKVLERLAEQKAIDSVRELLQQNESTRRAHTKDSPRLKPGELRKNYRTISDTEADRVVLLDDLITTGAHFVAARDCVREVVGPVPVFGVFLARTVH